jgi:hypothetical protein
MTQNIGRVDRWVRAIVGVALILLVFYGPQTRWGWLGLIPLATSLVGWCPLYSALGMSTRRRAGLEGHSHMHRG